MKSSRPIFSLLLIEWKRSIHTAAGQTLQSLADGPIREADLNDRASSETDWGIELRTRDRQRKLVSKIEAALRRIDQGEYGFCEVTGDPYRASSPDCTAGRNHDRRSARSA